jgi:hypothetical protein
MSIGGAPYGPLASTSCAYSINPEGTGTLTLKLPTFAFVLVSEAHEAPGIINSAGYIATFTAIKQIAGETWNTESTAGTRCALRFLRPDRRRCCASI